MTTSLPSRATASPSQTREDALSPNWSVTSARFLTHRYLTCLRSENLGSRGERGKRRMRCGGRGEVGGMFESIQGSRGAETQWFRREEWERRGAHDSSRECLYRGSRVTSLLRAGSARADLKMSQASLRRPCWMSWSPFVYSCPNLASCRLEHGTSGGGRGGGGGGERGMGISVVRSRAPICNTEYIRERT